MPASATCSGHHGTGHHGTGHHGTGHQGTGHQGPGHQGPASRPSEVRERDRDPRLQRLVRRAQRGSPGAFAILWQRYAPSVQGVLSRMVHGTDAEDLMQEVAIAALRALPSLQSLDRFPAWLCSIARNLGRDTVKANHVKANQVTAITPLSEAAHVAAGPPGDPTEVDEILARIHYLPECYREPLKLRLVFEMSGAEIAELTGLTEGSVRVNLYRGMRLLRQRLKHWDPSSR